MRTDPRKVDGELREDRFDVGDRAGVLDEHPDEGIRQVVRLPDDVVPLVPE